MRLRRAVEDDLAAIEAIVEAAYSPYIARIGRKPGPMLDDYRARIAAGQVTVAERETLVGLAVLLPHPPKMLLDNIAVHPDAVGVGVGRRLMAHAEVEARADGHTHVRLYTNVAMMENLKFYPRLGYVEVERVREDGFERVYFEKPLA